MKVPIRIERNGGKFGGADQHDDRRNGEQAADDQAGVMNHPGSGRQIQNGTPYRANTGNMLLQFILRIPDMAGPERWVLFPPGRR
jgi:hypothetical protein